MKPHVNDENGVWQGSHILNAADVFFKLFDFALESKLFFFADGVQTRFLLGLHFLQALDGCLDRFEIGQHAAQPALVNKRNTCALGLHGNGLARLALGADHQNGAAIGRQLTGKLHRLVVHRQRFLEVDDVNAVAMAENIRCHLRVPEAGLVTKVDAGFQHFAHGG